MYWRECFDNGNRKTGRLILEAHKFCECSECKARNHYTREPRNMVCVTVDCKILTPKAEEFIKNWRCKDGRKSLPTEYYSFKMEESE